jgi:hypothetical protein
MTREELKAKFLADLDERTKTCFHSIEEFVNNLSNAMKRNADILPEFHGQTDRGAGIIGAAMIEAEMGEFILSHLVNGNKKARDGKQMRVLFERGQAMQSFGPQIALAYAMGLMSEDVYYDLDCIREIRNSFAHSVWYTKGKHRTRDSLTFEQNDIKRLSLSLRYPETLESLTEDLGKRCPRAIKFDPQQFFRALTPRTRYEMTCQTLHLMLLNAQHPRVPIPLHYAVKLI